MLHQLQGQAPRQRGAWVQATRVRTGHGTLKLTGKPELSALKSPLK